VLHVQGFSRLLDHTCCSSASGNPKLIASNTW
jgi:hypothetical protein